MGTLSFEEVAQYRRELRFLRKLSRIFALSKQGRAPLDIARQTGLAVDDVIAIERTRASYYDTIPRLIMLERLTVPTSAHYMLTRLLRVVGFMVCDITPTEGPRPSLRQIPGLTRALEDGIISEDEYGFLFQNVRLVNNARRLIRESDCKALHDYAGKPITPPARRSAALEP